MQKDLNLLSNKIRCNTSNPWFKYYNAADQGWCEKLGNTVRAIERGIRGLKMLSGAVFWLLSSLGHGVWSEAGRLVSGALAASGAWVHIQ